MPGQSLYADSPPRPARNRSFLNRRRQRRQRGARDRRRRNAAVLSAERLRFVCQWIWHEGSLPDSSDRDREGRSTLGRRLRGELSVLSGNRSLVADPVPRFSRSEGPDVVRETCRGVHSFAHGRSEEKTNSLHRPRFPQGRRDAQVPHLVPIAVEPSVPDMYHRFGLVRAMKESEGRCLKGKSPKKE